MNVIARESDERHIGAKHEGPRLTKCALAAYAIETAPLALRHYGPR